MYRLPATIHRLLSSLVAFYLALLSFYFLNTRLEDYTLLDPASKVWVYSLAKTARLFEAKHYRAQSFSDDIRANLRNVAIPGSGIPMHLFFWTSGCAWLFVGIIYPAVALLTALHLSLITGSLVPIPELFREHLLQPRHWFARWRLNSFLVAWHAMLTDGTPVKGQYQLENKGAFLMAARASGIPISPFLDNVSCLYAKHVNMEGGLGIHVLRNFTHGGVWILQQALTNSPELQRLLPPGAPLSTLRVITASRHWLHRTQPQPAGPDPRASECSNPANHPKPPAAPASAGDGNGPEPPSEQSIHSISQTGDPASELEGMSATSNEAFEAEEPLARVPAAGPRAQAFSVMTVVLRAGRAGALTDHNCICFPLDPKTGELRAGKSNQHWYKIGAQHVGWIGPTFGKVWTDHPDQTRPGARVAGRHIPDMDRICSLCTEAHRQLLPDVPLVGWDVALTAEHGPVLLELNISCNFFLGDVEEAGYLSFMTDYISALHSLPQK